MSQLLYKYFLKKTNLDSVLKVGGIDDPYFETIPDDDLHFYQRRGAKRKRKLPGFIAEHDLKVLNSVKRKAYRLDLQLSMCGFRFGWAGVIGLLPWIGDVIALCFALQLVRKAEKIDGGLPANLRSKMMANVIFDFGIGLIPIVGDIINIAYKCNSRNFVMLEKYLVEKYHNKAGKVAVNSPANPPNDSHFSPKNGVSTHQTTGEYGDPARAV